MRAAHWYCWRCGRWHLLFPVSVPLGLGQVLERAVGRHWKRLLEDTPFLQWLPAANADSS
jgi:hypothetical protein